MLVPPATITVPKPSPLVPLRAVTIIAAATLIGAWIFQYGFGLAPCELCLEQRYAYYVLIVCGVALMAAVPFGLPRSALLAGLALMGLAALANAGLGAYHAGVEWGFWQGPTACTGARPALGSAGSLLEQLNTVRIVRCDEVQWRFLGLSLAGYNVLISLLMAALAALGLRRA